MANDEQSGGEPEPREEEGAEAAELLLFQTNECYVYMIPPRKSSASYRADEWNVNKWAWEGALRVVSKGEECMVKLEDKNTGELYAQAFVRRGQPLPVEPVIDSSRYFALCIEENFGWQDDGSDTTVMILTSRITKTLILHYGLLSNSWQAIKLYCCERTRHAFIGIGFRERPEAYDFQAALYDHVKYLNKKQAAEEMEQQYQTKASVDYSLKEGQTLKLQLKNPQKGTGTRKSTFFEQELDELSLSENREKRHPLPCLVPPPPPPAPSSPSATRESEKNLMPEKLFSPSSTTHTKSTKSSTIDEEEKVGLANKDGGEGQDILEDDFGDFQTAG